MHEKNRGFTQKDLTSQAMFYQYMSGFYNHMYKIQDFNKYRPNFKPDKDYENAKV
jgi:hypothetical protein